MADEKVTAKKAAVEESHEAKKARIAAAMEEKRAAIAAHKAAHDKACAELDELIRQHNI